LHKAFSFELDVFTISEEAEDRERDDCENNENGACDDLFKEKEQREKGKTLSAFLIYALVGVIGFVLTELLTIGGTLLIGEGGVWYLLLTCFVKGVVLVWNYVGRKIFVYRGK
jgi:hypothetical protein